MVAYEMTTAEQSLLVVLNRGGANQIQTTYDEVIFGDSTVSSGTLSVLADSVTILAHSGNQVEENQTNSGNSSTSGNTTAGNNTGVPSGNSTEENQTQQEEMQTCDGCCGDTFEVPISEPCPMVSCAPCDEVEDSGDSAEASSGSLVRNILLVVVLVVVLAFIQMSRRNEDNH